MPDESPRRELAVKEVARGVDELAVILKNDAVAGIRVNRQRRAGKGRASSVAFAGGTNRSLSPWTSAPG